MHLHHYPSNPFHFMYLFKDLLHVLIVLAYTTSSGNSSHVRAYALCENVSPLKHFPFHFSHVPSSFRHFRPWGKDCDHSSYLSYSSYLSLHYFINSWKITPQLLAPLPWYDLVILIERERLSMMIYYCSLKYWTLCVYSRDQPTGGI